MIEGQSPYQTVYMWSGACTDATGKWPDLNPLMIRRTPRLGGLWVGGVVAEETEIDNLASALSSTLAPPYSHWQALASAEEVF